ncbi:hypothetical protein JTB14_026464 [Gonioctena quinquepunctata]|nr:hypothetical protein JTB14_026464 [Gonioctena quinquepunctata]
MSCSICKTIAHPESDCTASPESRSPDAETDVVMTTPDAETSQTPTENENNTFQPPITTKTVPILTLPQETPIPHTPEYNRNTLPLSKIVPNPLAKRKLNFTRTETPTHSYFAIPNISKQKQKKTKTSSDNIQITLNSIRHKIENRTPPFTLNFTEICNFLENAIYSKTPEIICQDYSNDSSKLTEILNSIYSNIESKSLKSNITRLKKKLSLASQSATEESDAESLSQSDI